MKRLAGIVADRELGLLALTTPLLLFPGKWSLVGIGLIALTWACRWMARGHLSARTPMDVPILLLLAMTVVGLAPSVAVDLSLNRMCLYLLGVAWYYGMVNGLRTERHIHLMGIGLVVLGLVVAVVGLVGTDWEIGKLIEVPAIYERLPRPLIRGLPGSGVIEEYDLFNPRVVAGALALLAPVPLAYLVFGERWKLRLFSGLTALLMIIVLLLTQAPQGLVGLAAALILIGVWWSRWLLFSLVLGLGGLLLTWTFLDLGRSVVSRLPPGTLSTLNFGIYSRAVNGAWALATVRDMPYTGIGINTFPVVNQLYSAGRDQVPHAHNTLLQTAVDLGVPGLLVLLALLGALAYTLADAYRAAHSRNQRALLIGISGAVLAWLAYGLLDSITLGHKPAMALWVMLGVTAATRLLLEQPTRQSDSVPRQQSREKYVLTLLSLVVLLAMVALTRGRTIGAFYLNAGVMEAHRALASADSPDDSAHHLDAAAAYLRQSTHWNPGGARAYRLLDWMDGLQGHILSKPWPRDSANVERWRNVFENQE